ncbi:putative Myb-like transcription factor family protein [Tripterygium wilfordii]|uniref:Putative Myb-like transcription factor family protein n=1 Tax=Tripterygium wilfordii TaxID=458696 RepID=A0A7J7D9T1_TRIWF|nr:transcription factor MYBS3-like [Tripterygium wilfordii]KAF5743044.1 putative Myb-like transcription factor family protein [Tripterygium wilfordii]
MGRKCSHCGNTGHNSRTCTIYRGTNNSFDAAGGVRLFGVQLDMSNSSSSSCCSSVVMKKSLSMDSLYSSPSSCSSLCSSRDENSEKINIGYLSDGLIGRAQERKKGVPWTEEEHRSFLAGLEKLGKGDWRGIARNFVTTRTPTQVASHAQKYFLRQANLNKKKRRSSLFDTVGSINRIGNHVNTSNSMSSDTTLTLLGLGSVQQNINLDDQETGLSQLGCSNNPGEIWSDGSDKEDRKINPPNAAKPSLDLTLGAPTRHLEANQSSSSHPDLIRPISVT